MAESTDAVRELGRLADEASELQRRRYRVKDDSGDRRRDDAGGATAETRERDGSNGDSGAGTNLTTF